MAAKRYRIVCARDTDAGVWYVADSDVPGLAIEAPTKEAMLDRISETVPELLALNKHIDPKRAARAPLELLWANRPQKISLNTR